jgi:phage terminase large subunit-like protein
VIWALDYDPTLRIMYVSYDADKAVEEAGLARDDAERHADQLRFQLRPDRRARGMWRTDQGGGLYATGVNGAITGFPADALLADDLFKGWQAAHSATVREFVWNVYRSQMRLRIQGPRCPIIVAGTRWHEDDLTGRLRAAAKANSEADQWHVTRIPTLADGDDDPLGRQPGEPLETRRFPIEEVLARRATMGSYLWASLEQQLPAPEEGGELKRAWFRLDDRMPDRADDWLTSWDMKLKDKETGDYVVGQCWARTGTDFWLVDQLRGQWNQATTINAICLMYVRHRDARRHIIENTGNGPEVMETLRHGMPGYEVDDDTAGLLGMTEDERQQVSELRQRGMPGLVPNNPKGSKEVRARAVSPYAEAGNVHLPAGSSWTGGFLDEIAAFPKGSHDDQVDAFSQALTKLAKGPATARAATGPLPGTRPPTPLAAARGNVRRARIGTPSARRPGR